MSQSKSDMHNQRQMELATWSRIAVGSLRLLAFLVFGQLLLGGGLLLSLPGLEVKEILLKTLCNLIDGDLAAVDGLVELLPGSERKRSRLLLFSCQGLRLGVLQVLIDQLFDLLESIGEQEASAEMIVLLRQGLAHLLGSSVIVGELDQVLTDEAVGLSMPRPEGLEDEVPGVVDHPSHILADISKPLNHLAEAVKDRRVPD